MKRIQKPFLTRRLLFLAAVLIFHCGVFAAETNPAPKLTVELLDGSRVVGTSVAEKLKFHSALLGDLKLNICDIRSVDCISSNSVKLATANGDNLTVSFADTALDIKTGFGEVELAVKTLRKFSVTASATSAAHREGLVLFWAGNGDTKDNFGTDPDTAADLHSAEAVIVANNASLVSMQETRQFTFEAWIKPDSIPHEFPVLLAKGGNQPGVAYGGYEFLLNANGDDDLKFTSGTSMIDTHHAYGRWVNNHVGEWIHVAFTIDDRSKTAKFYVNGKPTRDESDYNTYFNSNAALNFDLPNPLYIGSPIPGSNLNRPRFDGEIRDVMLFNRALTAEEIQQDYAASHRN